MTDICYSFAEQLKNKLQDFTPKIAIILGSGLGSIAEQLKNPIVISYHEIENFPQSSVSGHAGKFIAGTLHGKKILCMQGRVHLYEGHSPQIISQIIKSFKLIGIDKLIVTNAAGSLTSSIPAGSIMMITDHINLSFSNPLIGPNDNNIGPRFPDMSTAYTPEFQQLARKIALDLNIPLKEGVYLMVSGPNFETSAEVKAFGILGGDAVGMSTVPEVISAAHVGIKVLGFSVITNLGTGLQDVPQSHNETLAMADRSAKQLALLLNEICKRI